MEYTPDGHSELYRWDDFLGITGGHAYSAMAMLSAITGCRIQAYGTDTLIYRASLGSSAAAFSAPGPFESGAFCAQDLGGSVGFPFGKW